MYAFSIPSLLMTCTFLAGSRDNLLKYGFGQEKISPGKKFDPVTECHYYVHFSEPRLTELHQPKDQLKHHEPEPHLVREFEHESCFSLPKLHNSVQHQQFCEMLQVTHESHQWSQESENTTACESSHLDMNEEAGPCGKMPTSSFSAVSGSPELDYIKSIVIILYVTLINPCRSQCS